MPGTPTNHPPHTHLPKLMSACLNGRTDVFVFTLPVSLQSVNVWAESSRNISSAVLVILAYPFVLLSPLFGSAIRVDTTIVLTQCL